MVSHGEECRFCQRILPIQVRCLEPLHQAGITDIVGFSFPQHCSERTVQHTISHHNFGEEWKVIVDDRTLECDAGGRDQQGLVRQTGT